LHVPVEDAVAALKQLAGQHSHVSVTWYMFPGALGAFPTFVYELSGAAAYGIYTEEFPFFGEGNQLANRRIKLREFPRIGRVEDKKHHECDIVLASDRATTVRVIKDRWGLFGEPQEGDGWVQGFTTSTGTSVQFSLTECGQLNLISLGDADGNDVCWTGEDFALNGAEIARDLIRMLHDPSVIAQAVGEQPPAKREPFRFGIEPLDSFFSELEEGSAVQVITKKKVAARFFGRVREANGGRFSQIYHPSELQGAGAENFYTLSPNIGARHIKQEHSGDGLTFYWTNIAGNVTTPDPDADYVFHIQAREVSDDAQRTLKVVYTVSLLRSPDGSAGVFLYMEQRV
jgi:hypothetical protein